MRIFAVDAKNDLVLSASRNLALREDLEAVLQAAAHAMKILLDEIPFHQARGLPYREAVWINGPNLRLFEDRARRILRSVPGVKAVRAFEASLSGEQLRYSVTLETVYGTGVLS